MPEWPASLALLTTVLSLAQHFVMYKHQGWIPFKLYHSVFCCDMLPHVKEYLLLLSVWIPSIGSIFRAISTLCELIFSLLPPVWLN